MKKTTPIADPPPQVPDVTVRRPSRFRMMIAGLLLLLTASVAVEVTRQNTRGSAPLAGQLSPDEADSEYPEYDSRGNLVRLTRYFDGKAITRDHYEDGGLVRVDAFSYDAGGVLTGTVTRSPDGTILSSTSFSDAGDGKILAVTTNYVQGQPRSGTEFLFDARRRLISSFTKDAQGAVVSQEHYSDGRMTARDRRTGDGVAREEYSYRGDVIDAVTQKDSDGRPLRMFRFEGERVVSDERYANGVKTESFDYAYDGEGNVTETAVLDGSGVLRKRYALQNGRVVRYEIPGAEGVQYHYRYGPDHKIHYTVERDGAGSLLGTYFFEDEQISAFDQYSGGSKTLAASYDPVSGRARSATYYDADGAIAEEYWFGSDGRASHADLYESGNKKQTVRYTHAADGGTAVFYDLSGKKTREQKWTDK